MKLGMKVLLAIAAIVFGGLQQANAQDDKLPSGEEVLKKYVDATGGEDAYKAIKSSRATGSLSVPAQGINGTLKVTTVKPNKVVADMEIEGFGGSKRVCDGERCWENSTMMGARLITGKEADQMMKQSDMERIYNPKKFFKKMETVGVEDVNGEKCYKVDLVTTEDEEITSYYSVESGLELKSVREQQTQMGPMKIESFSTDYKKFGDLTTAMKVEQKFSNGMSQVIAMDKVEYNVDVDEKAFEAPEAIQKLIDKAEAKKADKAEKADAEKEEAAAAGGGN